MQGKFFCPLVENIINYLFVELCTQCNCCKRLRFASGKQSRTMSCRQRIYLAGNLPDLVRFPAVETYIFIKDEPSCSFLMHFTIIFFDKGFINLILFSKPGKKFFNYGFKS